MITRISDIIDTDSQAEILAFLITATPRSFSVPELSQRLNLSHQAIVGSASELEKQNILKTFSKNRTTFYIVNQRHALIPQLKESFKKEHKQWPDELTGSLKRLGNLSGIFLSGLFVGRPELVVDLLLVGNVNYVQLEKFLVETSKQFGGELNYSIMSQDEFVMRRDTFDRFIKDIFDYPHIVLLDRSDVPATKKSEAPRKSPSKPKVVARPKPVAKVKPVVKPKPVVKAKPVVKPKVVAKSKSVAKPKKNVAKKAVKKTIISKPPVKKKVQKKIPAKVVPKKNVKKVVKKVIKPVVHKAVVKAKSKKLKKAVQKKIVQKQTKKSKRKI